MDLSKVVVVVSDSEAESEDEGVNELPCGNPDCSNQQPDPEINMEDSEAESEDEDVNELLCGYPDCQYHYPNQQPDHEIIMEVQCIAFMEDLLFTPDEDRFLRLGVHEFGTDFNAVLHCSWYIFQPTRSSESLFKRAIVLKLIRLCKEEH